MRIVSLAPSCTETAFALGLGDSVVGVTSWCDTPAEARSKPQVGGFIGIDAAKVLDLKPDLVLASSTTLGDQAKKLQQVRDAGVDVHVSYPSTVAGILEDVLRLGLRTGRHKEASELIDAMRAQIEAILDKVPANAAPVKVYYEEWPDPLMTVSDGIWIHDMIGLAGGTNVFAGAGVEEPLIQAQDVVQRAPEVMVVGWCGCLGKKPHSPEEVLGRPGWRDIPAAKAGRVHFVDDTFFTRPGPRIHQGLEELVRVLHPQA
jgi:iron complex transport system substrate-binding protein